MLTQEEYIWAWLFYLGGAAMFLVCWWFFTKKIPWREPRWVLRVIALVVLLLPWSSEKNSDYMSPAWLVSALEGTFDGGDAFWRAGLPLLVSLILTLLLSTLGYLLWRWKIARLRGSGDTQATSAVASQSS